MSNRKFVEKLLILLAALSLIVSACAPAAFKPGVKTLSNGLVCPDWIS